MAAYVCAVCGTLAHPANSNLTGDGQRFVHRACQPQPRRHSFFCVDDGCRGECQPEPVVEVGYLDPIEPPDDWSGADTRAEYEGAR